VSLYEWTEYAPQLDLSVVKASIDEMSKSEVLSAVVKLGLIRFRVFVPAFHDRKLAWFSALVARPTANVVSVKHPIRILKVTGSGLTVLEAPS
jgi:hypothetical protein